MSPYLKSNVVYKYTCQRDADISYLGETNHHIGTRGEEHLGTGRSKALSAVGSHILKCKGTDGCLNALKKGALTYKDFKIVKIIFLAATCGVTLNVDEFLLL